MNKQWAITALFVMAALYDGILGIVFLAGGERVFDWVGVTVPFHLGFVQFPALLLIIFAVMFAAIARDPVGNRGLIVYGVLLKTSYCGVVLGHWVMGNVSMIWKPFFVFDVIFLALFAWAYVAIGKMGGGEEEGT